MKVDAALARAFSLTVWAQILDKSVGTLSKWCDEGLRWTKAGKLKVVSVRDMLFFLDGREGYAPQSQRERLAREQGDKLSLENARRRGELIEAEQVSTALQELAADLAARHDAVPGRVAHEFARLDEPAVIADRLRDELRETRTGFAAAVDKLADSLGAPQEIRRSSEAAPQTKPDRVGRRSARAAPRKRRARKMAK